MKSTAAGPCPCTRQAIGTRRRRQNVSTRSNMHGEKNRTANLGEYAAMAASARGSVREDVQGDGNMAAAPARAIS